MRSRSRNGSTKIIRRKKTMPRKVSTDKNLVANLKELARGKSSYKNKYPYNLLYWDGARFWADCVNLYKALLNGRDIHNPVTGSFQRDLSNTGDVTEWGLLSQCSDISTDFGKLGNEFRCLYKPGHFGGYLGEEWEEPGQGIVNCVESTPAWEDGIQFSYVDKNGGRYWCKGGSQAGSWTHHGKPDAFIDYAAKEETKEETDKKTIIVGALPVIKSGSTGEVVKVLQTILKALGYYTGTVDGSSGPMTVAAMKAYQKAEGMYQDGIFGPKSWGRLLNG